MASRLPVSYRNLGKTGRLGNALFELATTAGVALKRGREPRFNADWLHRPYFSVPEEFYTDNFRGTQDVADCEELNHIDPRVRMYAQDVGLFRDILLTLREWLSPSFLAFEQMREAGKEFYALEGPTLSVHVRRGDNVVDANVPNKGDYFVLPPKEYFLKAIDMLGPKANSIAMFSDDPAWCQQEFGHLVDYVHFGTPRVKEHEAGYETDPVLDHIDLLFQARCLYHVITGSTYSIWGALLADSEHAVYYSPVYGRLLSYVDETLLFLPEWEKVTC